jgi:two-component system chemotaxis response regulator CheY
MKTPDKFVIIDDDFVNNSLFFILIRKALGVQHVQGFFSAHEGIRYIKNEYENAKGKLSIVLFLDINLPAITGWDVLDLLEASDQNIKEQLTVFMLSSSIDPKDKQRAMKYPIVRDFFEKPLLLDRIEALFKNSDKS